MKKPGQNLLLCIGILLLASGLRLPRLDLMPMHTDEAVHGIKFCRLLDSGYYQYDREEYHGPSLYYLSIPLARLKKEHNSEQLRESTLRLLSAIAGTATVLILFFLSAELGWSALLIGALILSVSPVNVYYSRYYIHEVLLLFFTAGTLTGGIRSLRTGNVLWMVFTGIFAGLMMATKESWIINMGLMLLAYLLMVWFTKASKPFTLPGREGFRWWHIMLVLLTALFVAGIFYSSFFSNPAGLKDALYSFQVYFKRAGHDPDHLHTWYFYFSKLVGTTGKGGMVWSEAWILLGSLTGLYYIFRSFNEGVSQHRFLQFIGIYGLLLTLTYSFIPYKTPWLLLDFYFPLIIISGFGLNKIYVQTKSSQLRLAFKVLFSILFLFTLWQSWQTAYRRYVAPQNPYVYAHSTKDVFEISGRIHDISARYPDGDDLYIEVIYLNHEYWPLPWYLRDLKNVGWWNHVDRDISPAPVILADPAVEDKLLKKLYEDPPPGKKHLYVPLFSRTMELRHGVEIRGYVRQDLYPLPDPLSQ